MAKRISLFALFVLVLLVTTATTIDAKGKKKKAKAVVEEETQPELPAEAETKASSEGGEESALAESAGEESAPAESAGEESAPAESAGDDAKDDDTTVDPPPGSQLEQDIVAAEKKAGDVFPTGACKKEIKIFCEGVDVGNRSLENCLSDNFKLTKAADASAEKKFSNKCLKAIRRFKVEVYKDISVDKEMMDTCKDDIASLCDDDFLYPEVGSVLACLREAKSSAKLTAACSQKVFEAQVEAASDFAMDPQLNQTCSADVARLCADVPTGEGRIQDCLRSHRNSINWECLAELFRQEIENSDDIRLNIRLFKACLVDKRRFCPDVQPGDARVKDCLEAHRLDADFSKTCKVEFDKMMERRASDFRLDYNLRKYCSQDISSTCYQDAEDVADVANRDAKVIECLQDYRDELKDPRCRQQVHLLTRRAAEDIRFNRPLAQACKDDSARLCKDIPPGHARVLGCLQDHRKALAGQCKEALFQEEVRFAEDIDFKFPLRQACGDEMKRVCKDSRDMIKCLQEKVDDADVSKACREEVNKDQLRAAQDYRLNFRLNKECFVDVEKFCLHACDAALESAGTETGVTCGGATLKCLTENESKLASKTCRQELFYFKKRMVSDLSLDVPLQRACLADVASKCAGARDHGKALACLRGRRDELAEECREEELRLSEMEASDIRLTPSLMNACGLELHRFCRAVQPGAGLAFRCLQLSISEFGMGVACRAEVDLQTLRHSSYYRLDASLKEQCEEDVERWCRGADEGREGHALTLKCLAGSHANLTGKCQTEVSYAVRMALWMFHRDADLTLPCADVIDKHCSNRSSSSKPPPVGVFAQCLLEQPDLHLGSECGALVRIIGREGAHVGGVIDTMQLEETINRLTQVAALHAQIDPQDADSSEADSPKGTRLVLTGWLAFVAVTALTALLLGAGYAVYRRFLDPTRNYTLMVKAGDV